MSEEWVSLQRCPILMPRLVKKIVLETSIVDISARQFQTLSHLFICLLPCELGTSKAHCSNSVCNSVFK